MTYAERKQRSIVNKYNRKLRKQCYTDLNIFQCEFIKVSMELKFNHKLINNIKNVYNTIQSIKTSIEEYSTI